MYGKVSDIVPTLNSIGATNYSGSGRLWGRHVLYNTHELYLLGNRSSDSPPMGSIENKTPTLYSIVNE